MARPGESMPEPSRAGLQTLRRDELLELRWPLVDHLVVGEVAADDVATAVERHLASDRVEVLRRHDVLEDLIAVVGRGLLERREDDRGSGVAVRGVDRGRRAVVIGQVL